MSGVESQNRTDMGSPLPVFKFDAGRFTLSRRIPYNPVLELEWLVYLPAGTGQYHPVTGIWSAECRQFQHGVLGETQTHGACFRRPVKQTLL